MKEYVQDLMTEEFSVIPLRKDKTPYSSHDCFNKAYTINDIDERFTNIYGIGVACGPVSANVECIDFDDHGQKYDIRKVFNEFAKNDHIKHLINTNAVFIQKTPSGGYHFIYRFDSKEDYRSQKLAWWDKDEIMIETRGRGGYFMCWPSPGYVKMHGDLLTLSTIDEFDRDLIIELCRSFNKLSDAENNIVVIEEAEFDNTDPVSFFNTKKIAYAKKILEDDGWIHVDTTKDKVERWRRPGKDHGISATWGHKQNAFYVFSSSVSDFKTRCFYSPFAILVKKRFNGNFQDALNWVIEKYYNTENPYIRIGTDYFRKITKTDRYNIKRIELKVWKKDEIKEDHGKKYLATIPKYNDFTMRPDNFNYQPVVDGCYNLYKPFAHEPKEGEIIWSKVLMDHIFGDQVDLGMRYLQVLYLHPDRMLPILVIVSKERSTGKTTFINWLNMIFGDNMAMIEPDMLTNTFNSSFAHSNVIAVEETLIEKQVAVEKLKALSTGKFITVNPKYVNPYKIPFYGKIILTSNNEDKFVRIDQEEIRFFIRKIGYPVYKNYNIEHDLMKEIPAFLYYLKSLPPVDFNRARTAFTAEELENKSLEAVKEQSRPSIYKELIELIKDNFANDDNMLEFEATPLDIKRKWFDRDSKIQSYYIGTILKDEFKMEPQQLKKYIPFKNNTPHSGIVEEKKTGRPFKFYRSNFGIDVADIVAEKIKKEEHEIPPF